MRTRSFAALGVVAAWLLLDFWRLWTPSLITLFGRAAETPAEIMGAYALAVMAVPLLLIAFVRRNGAAIAGWLLVAAFVVRILLRLNVDGGDIQLYGSSLGVALTVAAMCLAAGTLGRTFVPSVLLGVALSVSTHVALGSFGAVWRSDAADIILLLAQATILVYAMLRVCGLRVETLQYEPVAPRTGFLLFPALLLILLAFSNVGRASTLDATWAPLAVIAGIWASVLVALMPAPTRRPWVAAVLLVASTIVAVPFEVTRGGSEGVLSVWALVAFVVGPAALARLLVYAGAGSCSRRTGLATGGGAVVWTVIFFVFYAGYDLGYRADWALVVASIGIAGWVLVYRAGAPASDEEFRATAERIEESGARAFATTVVAGVVALIVALVGPVATIPTKPVAAGDDLVVAAYNVRMGYGIDGTFDPAAIADQIRQVGARVVLLSELDRGWLLNGGQDHLAILARMLGMQFAFGPAADQVWGDAILTDLDLSDVRTVKFPQFDALTGAAMTEATVTFDGQPIRVISTHLQPDGNKSNATERQAAIFAEALRVAASDGPVIGGGDLNTTPGSAGWQLILDSGVDDALAPIRPAFTSPTDDPAEEIDHLFTSGLTVTGAAVVKTKLSDHLMVVIRVQTK